ncbi:dipeptidase 1-like [Belonocnema kinseyi]|uniref:dipeptidase 1-like n=1 Tax=Belonocnema kinseyi TaxID=2817044 RepID=UPI00143D1546|nr:dipeptidase 1-like [Belonocnema kinseyi]
MQRFPKNTAIILLFTDRDFCTSTGASSSYTARSCFAANKGLVMVTFYNYFVKYGAEASVINVAEHIYHIRNLIGVDHIGVGGDFDGINKTPRGLEDVSRYPELFAELLRSGKWTVLDLKKVAGLNLLRILRQVCK